MQQQTPSSEQCTDARAPRVLIIVKGGVASYVADDGIDVAIFDFDDFESDPSITHKPAAHFFDLAAPIGIPVENTTSTKA